MKRSRLRPVSAKRLAQRPANAIVREYVFARDTRCVLWGHPDVPPCHGAPLTPHHLEKAWKGSGFTPENLITLCAFHNDIWVEGNPDDAWEMGLVVRNGDTHEDAAQRRSTNRVPWGLFGLGADWGDR